MTSFSTTLTRSLLGASVALILAACASAPAKIEGGVLTSATGFTLYTFDRDAANSGKSVCNGPCAVNWPPLMATEGWQNDHLGQAAHDKYSVITRDDGKKQWAYKGKPLYFWVKDVKAGDKTGEGVNNVWHVAK